MANLLLGAVPSLREVAVWKHSPVFSKGLLVTLGDFSDFGMVPKGWICISVPYADRPQWELQPEHRNHKPSIRLHLE